MSLATKLCLLGVLTISVAPADSLTVVNANFGNAAVQCSSGYAYQSYTGGNCGSPYDPQQGFNSSLGIGWTFAPVSNMLGAGLTNPNTTFEPPPFAGLPFGVAAFLQGNTAAFGQTITGFVPDGLYTLHFYLGSRYTYGGYSGNQTVEATIDGQVVGTWALTSNAPFTFRSASFTAGTGGSHILEFVGTVSGDETAFVSGVNLETRDGLTVSPSTGVPGTGVVASASGFTPFETVNLVAYASAPTMIGTVSADASGTANLEGRLPQTPFGACGLQAAGQSSGTVVSGIISVRPWLSVSPNSGAAGPTVTVTGFGYAAGEAIGVAWSNPPTSLGSATANKNGSFSAQLVIPSGAAAGTDEVVARGQRTDALAGAQITVQ
jgi:hypothetical protein